MSPNKHRARRDVPGMSREGGVARLSSRLKMVRDDPKRNSRYFFSHPFLDECPMFPRISCRAWWRWRTSCGFPYRKPHTRIWLMQHTGNPGRTSVHGPKTGFSNAFTPRARTLSSRNSVSAHGANSIGRGCAPSFSSHVRWCEHGAPVHGGQETKSAVYTTIKL